MFGKDLISIHDLTVDQVAAILDTAIKVKANPEDYEEFLRGCTMAMIFEKPSLRTRVSFEAAMIHLGGNSMFLGQDVGFGRRESAAGGVRERQPRTCGRPCSS